MNNKLKNKLRFWIYLILIIALYGGFMAYFCIAEPCEPNDVIIEKEKNAETIKEENKTETQKSKDIAGYQAVDKNKTNEQEVEAVKQVGPEVYLCEITAFYERVITILSIIIFLILGLNFLYIHRSSRSQSEEMARDALKDESFSIIMGKMINERFAEARDKGEISEIHEVLDELDARIGFLEKAITEKSYASLEEGPSERKTEEENEREN